MSSLFPVEQYTDPGKVWSSYGVNSLRAYKGDLIWLAAIDILRGLDNAAKVQYLEHKIRNVGLGIQSVCPTHEFDGTEWIPLEFEELPPVMMICQRDLHEFVTKSIRSARKTKRQKQMLLARFNIEVEEVEVPIEEELLEELELCCPFKVLRQHRVGTSRIDAFIPKFNLGIQIDENGHSGYNSDEEKDLNDRLANANIVLLRFNPDVNRDTASKDFVREVWTKISSIEMRAFRMMNNL